MRGLPLQLVASLSFAILWVAWATLFFRQRAAAKALVGVDLADALGPVCLAARLRAFVGMGA